MLNQLSSPKTKHKSKRIGRGIGSGKGGHTVGRGTKGQRSRSGYSKPGPAFEGGQNPLSRRLPKKKGFDRAYFVSRVTKYTVKLSVVSDKSNKADKIDLEKLLELGLVKANSSKSIKVKVVFDKEIDKALNFENVKLSEQAQKAVEKAGGSVK